MCNNKKKAGWKALCMKSEPQYYIFSCKKKKNELIIYF